MYTFGKRWREFGRKLGIDAARIEEIKEFKLLSKVDASDILHRLLIEWILAKGNLDEQR